MKYPFAETTRSILATVIIAIAVSTGRGVDAQVNRQGTVRLSVPAQSVLLPLTANLSAYEESVRGGKGKVLSRFADALNSTGVSNDVNTKAVTIFAPSNTAFTKTPKKWTQRDVLASALHDHVVTGRYTYAELLQRTQASGGDLALRTLSGGILHVRTTGSGNSLFLEGARDPAGIRRSRIALSQNRVVTGKNGTAFVIDYFVMPILPQRID